MLQCLEYLGCTFLNGRHALAPSLAGSGDVDINAFTSAQKPMLRGAASDMDVLSEGITADPQVRLFELHL